MMETNPYKSLTEPGNAETQPVKTVACPECGKPMEPGYLTSGARMYWRSWSDRSLLVPWASHIPGTRAAFTGCVKLSGLRCQFCELVIFRFGAHQGDYAPLKHG